MKNKLRCLLLIGVFYLVTGCQTPSLVNTKIISENGSPIENVKVDVRYLGYDHWEKETDSGLTDKKGEYRSSGVAKLRIHVFASKEGYYDSVSGRLNRKENHDVELTLREKKNPIPLYAKDYTGVLPGLGEAYGFDFEKGDWVQPHGEGLKGDIFFKAVDIQNKDGEWGGRLEISFEKKEEGIQLKDTQSGYLPLSEMIMPHTAPEVGYRETYSRVEYGYQDEIKKRKHLFLFVPEKKPTLTGR